MKKKTSYRFSLNLTCQSLFFFFVEQRFSSKGPSSSKAAGQPTIQETFEKQLAYAPTSKAAKDLNSAVAYFIAKDMMPFQTVEKPIHKLHSSFPLSRLGIEVLLPRSCFVFPEDHTAENILEFFENMLQEWSITRDNFSSITTDNASNMKKAFQGLPCVWLSLT